jgi:hypothetical protein
MFKNIYILIESHESIRGQTHRITSHAFPYLYRSFTRDICKISTFSNFRMFGWIKIKLFTYLIRGFSFYYVKQIDNEILPLSVQL